MGRNQFQPSFHSSYLPSEWLKMQDKVTFEICKAIFLMVPLHSGYMQYE